MQLTGNNTFGRPKIAALLTYAICLAGWLLFPGVGQASSAQEIDIEVNETLKQFKQEVKGSNEFLAKTNGGLVFPSVIKAGLVVGGEYGERGAAG